MQRIQKSQTIMDQFAMKPGLSYDSHSQKSHAPIHYLWTDAFAVCNYLGLYHQSAKPLFLEQAVRMVEQVHYRLAKPRKDNNKTGWVNGFNEGQFLEWQEDHCLTKWMHALNCVSRDTGDSKYNRWALELAKTAFNAFVYQSASDLGKNMRWKISVDLSRPLVTLMGQQDPLDTLLTYQQLQTSAQRFSDIPTALDLESEITEMSSICLGRSWTTHDALGIGGLLTNSYKLMQLIALNHLDETDRLEELLQDIEYSLHTFIRHKPFNLLAEHRLAFRELGLAIGLQTISKMQDLLKQQPDCFKHPYLLSGLLDKLSAYGPIHEIIEQFWLKPKHQCLDVWQNNADINNVMLATSLHPEGYLHL